MTGAASVRSDCALEKMRCVGHPRLPENGDKLTGFVECAESLEGAIRRHHHASDSAEG
jgi:hypothetical protein